MWIKSPDVNYNNTRLIAPAAQRPSKGSPTALRSTTRANRLMLVTVILAGILHNAKREKKIRLEPSLISADVLANPTIFLFTTGASSSILIYMAIAFPYDVQKHLHQQSLHPN